jgi:hypothetical protein
MVIGIESGEIVPVRYLSGVVPLSFKVELRHERNVTRRD